MKHTAMPWAEGIHGGEQWNLETRPAEAVRLVVHLWRIRLSWPCHPQPRPANAGGLPRVDTRRSDCREHPRVHGSLLRLRLPRSQGQTLDLRAERGCEHPVPRGVRFFPRAEAPESAGCRLLIALSRYPPSR